MAAAQPWHSLASPFDFILIFFPSSLPLHFLPSLSFSFKWKSLASWGRLGGQGEPRQAADKECGGGEEGISGRPAPVGRAAQALAWWDPAQGKSSHCPPGCRLALPLCSGSPAGKPHAGGGTDPKDPFPEPARLLWKGLCSPARGWHPKTPCQALGRWCLVESGRALRHPAGKAVLSALARS